MNKLMLVELNSPQMVIGGVIATFFLIFVIGYIWNLLWKRQHSATKGNLAISSAGKFVGKYDGPSGLPIYLAGKFKQVFKTYLSHPKDTILPFDKFDNALRAKFGAGYNIAFMQKSDKQVYPSQLCLLLSYKGLEVVLDLSIGTEMLVTDKENPPKDAILAGDYVDFEEYYNVERIPAIANAVLYSDQTKKFKQSLISDLMYDKNIYIVKPELTPMPQSPTEKKAKIRKIVYSPGMGFNEQIEDMRVFPMKPGELDLNYAPCEIEFEGEKGTATMSEIMELMPICIDNRENLLVFGDPGTGKTILAEFVLYHAKQVLEEKVKIFYIPANIIEKILTPEFGVFFPKIFDQKVKNLIFIDECQRLLASNFGVSDSPLLEMMSGSQKELYNLSFVLAFNSNLKDLDRAIFRSGRAGMIIQLRHLQEEQARKKLAQLIDTCPPTHFIDQPRFEKLLATDNYYFEGDDIPYAHAGEMTLADIYSCKISKAKHDVLKDIFQKKILNRNAPSKKLVKPK